MTEEEKATLEVWKVTVDVQKHFNDLSMRVRNIAISVVAALLAAAGYALKDGATVTLAGQTFSLTAWIFVAAIICWFAFYMMDLHWYHRLLRGAVKHGKTVERSLEHKIPVIGLTRTIEQASPIHRLPAGSRLRIFYGLIGVILIGAALAAFHAGMLWFVGLGVISIIGVITVFVTRPMIDDEDTGTTPGA